MSILFKWTSHKQNAVIWILLQLGALRINPPCEQYCFLLEQKWQNQEIQNSVIFKRNVDVSQKWNWSILLSSWRVLKIEFQSYMCKQPCLQKAQGCIKRLPFMHTLTRLSQTKSWIDGLLVLLLTNHHHSVWAVGVHQGILPERNTTFWSGKLRGRPTDSIFSMLKAKRTSSELNFTFHFPLRFLPSFLDICSAQALTYQDRSISIQQPRWQRGANVVQGLTSEMKSQGCTGLKIWVWLWQQPLRWCLTAHISGTEMSTYWEHPSGFFLTVSSGVPDPSCLVSSDWNK